MSLPLDSFLQLDLDDNLNKAIKACGHTTPTPVQAKSIPPILAGKDVVVSAPTGSGKTGAFVLPALHRLSLEKPLKKTRILILTPTRELANQITKAADLYGKYLNFNIVSLVGGMPYHHQIKDLARGADIIVATPGRLMDHIEQKRVDLAAVDMLILDEADRMLDMGFIDDVQYIAKLTPSKRQTLLFSATLDNKLMSQVKHLLKNPIRIDLSNETISVPDIKQELYKADSPQQKARLLKHFLNEGSIYKAIIFCSTKIGVDRLAANLREQGFAAFPLHGDLKQNARTRTLEQFRRGKIQLLIATDVAARGIDVSDISHVFNYDLPRFSEDYVHRIGRTGRAGKSGVAISFVAASDKRHLQQIERYIGQRLHLISNMHISDKEISRPPYVAEPVRQGRGSHGGRHDRDNTRSSRYEKRDGRKGDFSDARSHRGERSFREDRHSSFKEERYAKSEHHERAPASRRYEGKFMREEGGYSADTYEHKANRGYAKSSYNKDERSPAKRSRARGDERSFNKEEPFAAGRKDRSSQRFTEKKSFKKGGRFSGESSERQAESSYHKRKPFKQIDRFASDSNSEGVYVKRSFRKDESDGRRSFRKDDAGGKRSFRKDDTGGKRSFRKDDADGRRSFKKDDTGRKRSFRKDEADSSTRSKKESTYLGHSYRNDAAVPISTKPKKKFAGKPKHRKNKTVRGKFADR